MIKSGLTLYQALGMTFIVFAGSAQLASLPLIAGAAPVWVVVVTAVVVNLRFVIYSAAVRYQFYNKSKRWRLGAGYLMGDIGFVMFMQRIEREPGMAHRDAYFMGANTTNWVAWQIGSLIGIFAASQVPLEWGLGLAGTLALLALVIPMLATRPVQVGVAVSAALAVVTHGLPFRLYILVAVIGGICAALLVERSPSAVLDGEGPTGPRMS
jgi:predicted branched-subunit amino acid permease